MCRGLLLAPRSPRLQRCALRTAMGGEALSAAILAHLESKSVVVRPRYAFKKVENAAGEYDVSDVDVASRAHARGVCSS